MYSDLNLVYRNIETKMPPIGSITRFVHTPESRNSANVTYIFMNNTRQTKNQLKRNDTQKQKHQLKNNISYHTA